MLGRRHRPLYLDSNADGLRWSFEGNVNIDADYWLDEVQFEDVSITDEEIDEVVKQEADKTQVGQ